MLLNQFKIKMLSVSLLALSSFCNSAIASNLEMKDQNDIRKSTNFEQIKEAFQNHQSPTSFRSQVADDVKHASPKALKNFHAKLDVEAETRAKLRVEAVQKEAEDEIKKIQQTVVEAKAKAEEEIADAKAKAEAELVSIRKTIASEQEKVEALRAEKEKLENENKELATELANAQSDTLLTKTSIWNALSYVDPRAYLGSQTASPQTSTDNTDKSNG